MPASATATVNFLGFSLHVLVAAGIVAGLVSLAVAVINWLALSKSNADKLATDRHLAEQKIASDLNLAVSRVRAEQESASSERAWTEYEKRRDVYGELIERVDSLFGSGISTMRIDFLRSARKVRLIGSDEVVIALNAMTDAIKNDAGKESHLVEEEAERCFRLLSLALRKDLRTIHSSPPTGTTLDESAFPIEGYSQ